MHHPGRLSVDFETKKSLRNALRGLCFDLDCVLAAGEGALVALAVSFAKGILVSGPSNTVEGTSYQSSLRLRDLGCY